MVCFLVMIQSAREHCRRIYDRASLAENHVFVSDFSEDESSQGWSFARSFPTSTLTLSSIHHNHSVASYNLSWSWTTVRWRNGHNEINPSLKDKLQLHKKLTFLKCIYPPSMLYCSQMNRFKGITIKVDMMSSKEHQNRPKGSRYA